MRLYKLLFAVSFLTLIPLQSRRELSEKEIGESSAFFPLVGFFLGLVFVALHILLSDYFSQKIVAVFIVLSSFVITRGFHIDGFCDLADAFWGGKTKEDALRIMSDSHIGAFGAASLFLLLILKVELLASVLETKSAQILILMPLLGRWAMVILGRVSLPAKSDGLGTVFANNIGRKEVIWATFFAGVVSFFTASHNFLLYLAFIYFFTMICAYIFRRTIGGVTGDVFGAQNEMAEVATLLIFYLMNKEGGYLNL